MFYFITPIRSKLSIITVLFSLFTTFNTRAASFSDFAETFAGLTGLSPNEVIDGFNLVVEHGTCIPRYIPGDPEAYPLGALTMALKIARAQGYIAKDFNQCNQKINIGDKAVSAVLAQSSKFMSFLSSSQQEQLKQSAVQNMPGLSFLIELAECSCAVAVTDTPIDAQIQSIKYGVEAAWDIYKLGGKLVMAAGKVIASTGAAIVDVANDIGCTLGIGGCDEFNPEKFYQAFKAMRSQGTSYEQIRSFYQIILDFGGLRSTSGYADFLVECENRYANEMAAELAAKIAAEEALQLKSNQEIAAKASAGWAVIWAKMWAHDCKDNQCANGMVVIANQRAAEEADPATLAAYGGSTTKMKEAMNQKYNPRVALNLELDKAREANREAIRNNPSASPDQRLPLLACGRFLGRGTEYLCKYDVGFGACSVYVGRGLLEKCYIEGQNKKFATDAIVEQVLTAKGCSKIAAPRVVRPFPGGRTRPTAPKYLCISNDSLNACEEYRLGGVKLACAKKPLHMSNIGQPPVITRPPVIIRPRIGVFGR